MKIVFYHHIALPVAGYGGTERILFWHMKELAKLGHHVTLIGHPDSKVEDFGIKLIPLEEGILRDKWEDYIPKDSDIIHLQFNHLIKTTIPQINTVHGNGQPGEIFQDNSVFVSLAHARLHNSECFVHNAMDFEEYPVPQNLHKSKNDMLFLAKASWSVKNLKDCKKVAINNHIHLHIAGGRSFSFSRYIHNYGQIGGAEKLNLIRKSDALIFPVRWPEPFGIALIEAMSQGLGVFGSHYGSLPEVIGEAGIICKNFEELDQAVKDFSFKLTPAQIIDYTRSTFNVEKYSKSYLHLYEKIIKGEKLNNKKPSYSSLVRAEELLPF